MKQTHSKLLIYMADLSHVSISMSSDFFPLNIGFLAAYIKQELKEAVHIELFKNPYELQKMIESQIPDVIAFSNYPWNLNLSIMFAKQIKQLNNNVLTIMGGPNLPRDKNAQEKFVSSHKEYIDFHIFEEGELHLCNLISRYIEINQDIIALKEESQPGCLYINNHNLFCFERPHERIKDLDQIPSPYLSGILDKFFAQGLTPFMQTNRGCPFHCSYCHEGADYFNHINFFSIERIFAEIDYIASHKPLNPTLAFADSNFGMFERDASIAERIRYHQDKISWPPMVYASTGKNKKNSVLNVISNLKPGSLNFCASVQSLDTDVLKQIKRDSIKTDVYFDVLNKLRDLYPNNQSVAETILALPGETKQSHFDTIKKLLLYGIDKVIPFTFMILNGSDIEEQYHLGKLSCSTKYRVLPRSFGLYKNFFIMEVERVCVETDDVSLDDYYECRLFDFLITNLLFGRTDELLWYLESCKISRYDYIEYIYNNLSRAPLQIHKAFMGFLKETKDELWDSEQSLIDFYKKQYNYNQLLTGKIGGNLIEKYNNVILGDYYAQWVSFLCDIALALLPKENKEMRVLELQSLSKYLLAKYESISIGMGNKKNNTIELKHDIEAWKNDHFRAPLSNYLATTNYTVSLSEQMQKNINDYIECHGDEPQAIARMQKRLNMRQMSRDVLPIEVKK